jgi:hypothetical protein
MTINTSGAGGSGHGASARIDIVRKTNGALVL